MARKPENSNLMSRDWRRDRAKRCTPNPYSLRLSPGLFIEYAKGKSGAGRWGSRLYLANEGKYHFFPGEWTEFADDYEAANGATILDFKQASEKARKLAEQFDPATRTMGPYTVGDVMADYAAYLKEHCRPSTWRDAVTRIRSKINCEPMRKGRADKQKGTLVEREKTPKIIIGKVEAKKLTTSIIREWFRSLRRERKNHKDLPPEELERRRCVTDNRTLTLLKAGLNRAWREEKIPGHMDAVWRRVQPYEDVSERRPQVLKPDQVSRIVNACEPDLRELVQGAYYTGCRYSELAGMRVKDFSAEGGTVFVAHSKVKKTRTVGLNGQGLKFFTRLCAGRHPDEFIFLKDDSRFVADPKNMDHIGQKTGKRKWSQSDHLRGFAEAVKKAKNIPAGTTFYTLRHSYATELYKSGELELLDIAKSLGHSGTRMVEKHYVHADEAAIHKKLKTALPTLDIEERGNVAEIA
jgi:integrase